MTLSEYNSVIYDLEGGTPPKINERVIQATWNFLRELYDKKLVKANHDVNKGGFIITIAEMCFKNRLGANLDLKSYNINDLRDDILLFSESAGRFVIESEPRDHDKIMNIAKQQGIFIRKIGEIIQEPKINVNGLKGNKFSLQTDKLKELYDSTLPNLMEL